MCGVFGSFCDQGNLSMDRLERATSTLYHRGPDGKEVWMSKDKRIGLGHTRLSIIDLEGGQQPLKNEDESICAVVNGEIYDFKRIQGELQAKGHRFRTNSDSEVLVHLYEELGLDALHELRGEFAFILWDSKNQRLIGGRDRFGIKPLYYSFFNNTLFLASEIKALLAAGVPAKWDDESFYIGSHLGFTTMQNRSLFKGVFQVPAGHVLVANKYQHRLHCYWDFNYPLKEMQNNNISDKEAIETFRDYFDEAVKLRLHADVPVGVYLSGGLDSCAILGTVAKFRGPGVKAFTIGFDDATYDETAIAKEMAEFAGAEFNPYMITKQALAQNFVESIRHCETTVVNPHTVAKFMLSKHVQDSGYKVVLTGEGSDEILGGYAHFRQDLLLNENNQGSNRSINDSLKKLKQNNLFTHDLKSGGFIDDNAIKRRLGFIPSWLKMFMSSSNDIKGFFSKETLEKFSSIDPYSLFLDDQDVHNQLSGRDILNQSEYLWSKLMLPNYLLCSLGDRMEMAHSVEGRVPFLDHKLVEFVTTLPTSLKIRNMNEKYILREAIRPVITNTVYNRRKHPFVAPLSTNKIEDPMFTFMHEYIGDNLDKMPFFDKNKIGTLLNNIRKSPLSERGETDALIMTIGSLVALQEQFGLV
ncbi:asparagine synthase (glutamine-hydrolyzing) [Clostridium estertheticum]|uniref:asparagine synthase (glutamine-hydrolyzing) n=1 Tax=Clostridium estertheticum TaxID=238834 RepID=UPI001C7D9F53|nr:asparagine synthase (glutamine-hydrolyzing) [Clostridium estertheticum]MBX4258453.1 asparagine synthase (glutamine-hydrolyzing) [Clostridium estertheticum]WLC69597.1 asparagine synthase (glutamine-hydrolyzing) [Clostridium estertheticum]